MRGAVLRWRNPDTGLLFLVRIYVADKCRLLLDGAELSSGMPLIPFGDHVFSLQFDGAAAGEALFAFAAVHDESQLDFPRVSRPSGQRVAVLSAADGTWKYATTEPAGDDWTRPGFDDAGWSALPAREPPKLGKGDSGSYRLKALREAGAVCLGAGAARAWVRKRFTLAPTAPPLEPGA